jgi:chromosome segregation ATPase
MAMFRAIARYFRALGYLLTGRIDAARMTLGTSPHVIQATYDHVIEEKKNRIQQYKDAVAGMIVQEEKKAAELKRQSEEVARLQKLKEGAAAMARKVVQRHNGNVEAVKTDPEYVKCQAAYKDFSSTLEEKEARCADLEEDIKNLRNTVNGHKTQLQSLLRDLERISQEKHETVADVMTAREERELADMIAGISEDRTAKELEGLRDLREKARAEARVSREMAGIDTHRAEEEFLQYATETRTDTEFDKLIGLAKEQERPKPEAERAKIPEA